MDKKRAPQSQVNQVRYTGDLKGDLSRVVDAIGGWREVIAGGRVLVKPNYNSAHPPPGSTAPDFLHAVLSLLQENGVGELLVGESTSQLDHRKVMEQVGAYEVTQELGVPLIIFDEEGWEKVFVGGEYLKRVRLAKALRSVDKIIYLCCPKTHHAAQFTGSLKLGMGFVNNWLRTFWHIRHLQEKIADLNLVMEPDLILADMRRTFIDGGPATGEMREPGLLLASRNRVALDMEAVRIIQSFPGHSLPDDPKAITHIGRAIELGLGKGRNSS